MEQAQAFLTYFSGPMGYVFFFFLIMACGMGVPFNSDISLITASILAAHGYFTLWILMVLAFFALLCGDSFTFSVGRRWGLKLVKRRPFKWLFPENKVQKAQDLLKKHGTKFIFMIRFLPLIRTVLFFSSGTLQVKPKTFLMMDAAATVIYLPLLMGSAYYASENIDQVFYYLKRFQFGFLAIFCFAILHFMNQKRKKKRKKRLAQHS